MLPYSYEVLASGGPLLALMATRRLRTAKLAETPSKLTIVGLRVCIGLYCFAAVVSLYFIVFPFDPTARDGAAGFIEALKTIPQLTISVVIGGLFLLIRSGRHATQVAVVVILSGASLVLLRPSLWAEGWQTYQGRGVSMLMMVIFMALIAMRSYRDERVAANDDPDAPKQIRAAFLPALLLFSVQLVPLTANSVGFDRWVHSFADFVNSHEGVVTNLAMTLEVDDSYSYLSPYANPYLSVLVACDNDRAIVLSPGVEVSEATEWMPRYFWLPDETYEAGSALARC